MKNKWIVRRGTKIQAWQDSDKIVHIVLYPREPYKLACHPNPKIGMYGYQPRLARPDRITCEDCRKVLLESSD